MANKKTIVRITIITPIAIPAIAPVDNPEFSRFSDSLGIGIAIPDSLAVDEGVAPGCRVVGASRNICSWFGFDVLHAAGIKSVVGQLPCTQGLLRQHPMKVGFVSLQVYQLLLLALRQSFGKIELYTLGLNDAG
jgi:hypothetical protein